jgi:hypothetical protein
LKTRPVTGTGSGNETPLADDDDGEVEVMEQPVRARVRRRTIATGVFIGTSSVAAPEPEASRDPERLTRSHEIGTRDRSDHSFFGR